MSKQDQLVEEKFRKIPAIEMTEGDGVTVRRLFPTNFMRDTDPFVLMDEFFVDPPHGFPQHPHKGFEAVTYMLEGAFHHKDDIGNDSIVHEGGIQMFTAGKGIQHSEQPAEKGTNHGIQLWVNLPKSKKEIEPKYEKFERDALHKEETDRKFVRTIAGKNSPMHLHTEVVFKDIALPAKTALDLDVNPDYRGFIYVITGHVRIGEINATEGESIFFENSDKFTVHCKEDTRFILIEGKPHDEPIIIRGPFVE